MSRTWLAVWLAAMPAGLAAGDDAPRFTRLSVEDGLSQSSVQQILQDRYGLLWFGTQEGLNRFDGYRFTVHRSRDADGFLHDHDITALTEDSRGNLWVGTSRGLYRYDLDTGRFDACPPPVDRLTVTTLIRGGDGRIFFVTSDGRLRVLDPADPERRSNEVSGGAFAPLTQITAVARGPGGAIWAAANGSLFSVDARATEVLADLGHVAVLATDARGDVWIGQSAGDLLRYRPTGGAVDRFPQAPRNPLAILPARDGEIWIGARRGGLSRLDPASGRLDVYRHDVEDPGSLAGDDVAAIYEDAAGTVWIGSWNAGLSRFDPHAQAFRTFAHRPADVESLPSNDVTALIEVADGTLWTVSRGGIVSAGDPRSGRFRGLARLTVPGRFSGIGSWDAQLLIASTRGLTILDPRSGRAVPIDAALAAHRLHERSITAIRTEPGVAWLASEKDLFRVTRADARLPPDVTRIAVPIAGAISVLSAPGPGRIWIGSDGGEIARAEWTDPGSSVTVRSIGASAQAKSSLAAHGFVSTLHEDRQGRLWVGTRRGLGRVEPGGEVSWVGEPGLPSTTITGIAGDANGALWVGHNRGLTRIDPATGTMTHFGERDGAQGKGYADGAWAAGGSGLIYFAGAGITAFDPREVRASPVKPRIVFTALEILHRVAAPRWQDPASPLEKAIDAQREVTLGPEATVFSVEMAPLHYADPQSNRLMYRLDGFDPEWIETGVSTRVATYTNLAPGRYVLRARAGTRNGVWSDEDATLAIHLLPPWWRTRSALALWTSLALIAAALAVTSARRRARVKLALLERETLRRESLTDPLTGLHNRRFLVSWLEQEVPKVQREYRAGGATAGADLLLFLVDVDHFKSINDRHSHAAGDRVLARIAATLKGHVRESDLAVRWGGDEFLIVTRSFPRERAAESAERLRAVVEALGSGAEGDPGTTASVGFASFPFLPHDPDALTWQQTLELADRALGLTKRRKRNSFTGLRATSSLTAAEVRDFLSHPSAHVPRSMEIEES